MNATLLCSQPTTTDLRIAALEARLADLETRLATGRNVESSSAIEPGTLYTAQEAARLLRCGKTNVYDLWESGELAVINTGRSKKGKRVRGSDLATFLDSRKEGGPQPKQHFRHLRNLN